MDRKVERCGKAAGDMVLKGLSVCTLKLPRRLEVMGVGVEMKSRNHCQSLPWVRAWPWWRRREDKLDCGQRSQRKSKCAGGQRTSDLKAAVWGSVGCAAWEVRGWAPSKEGCRESGGLSGRQVSSQASWMRAAIDELADYRAGVPENPGKCSREGLEGWLKGKKAILSTRI